MKLYVTIVNMDDPLIKMLSRQYQIVPLTSANMMDAITSSDSMGYIIDCNKSDCMNPDNRKQVKMFLDNNKSVIILNTDEEIMTYLIGIGVDCNHVVVQNYMSNQYVVNCLDAEIVMMESGTEGKIYKDGEEVEQVQDNNQLSQENFTATQSSPMKLALKINSLIQNPPKPAIRNKQSFEITAENAELPPGITKTYYLTLSGSSAICGDTQVFNNEIVFSVEMFASYQNPPYKYVQITTLGSGFNPTNGKGLQYNGKYSKGWWQDLISIKHYPYAGVIPTQLSTSPQNVNNETTYKVVNTVKLDVDISKNPAFKPNYTVSNEYTSTIKDFEIINKSTPNIADWDFQLGMTKNNIEDVFEINIIDKPYVRDLPTLAIQNLQPYCSSQWFVPNTENGVTGFRLSALAKYYRAYSEGFGLAYGIYWKYCNWGQTFVTTTIDYSQINP